MKLDLDTIFAEPPEKVDYKVEWAVAGKTIKFNRMYKIGPNLWFLFKAPGNDSKYQLLYTLTDTQLSHVFTPDGTVRPDFSWKMTEITGLTEEMYEPFYTPGLFTNSSQGWFQYYFDPENKTLTYTYGYHALPSATLVDVQKNEINYNVKTLSTIIKIISRKPKTNRNTNRNRNRNRIAANRAARATRRNSIGNGNVPANYMNTVYNKNSKW